MVCNSTNSNTGGTAISGATSTTYSPPTSVAGTYYYYVVATGSCSSAASNPVTIQVNNCTTAVNDVLGTVTPGTNTSSVFANDKSSNGTTPTSANTDVSLTNNGGLTGVSINADGTIAIPANAAPGSYTLTYRICSPKGQTTNCSPATATVYVDKDSDGDGVFDLQDLDDDNDGILDCLERGITPISQIDNLFNIPTNDAVKIAVNEVQLTPDASDKGGRMWSNAKVDFSRSFTMKVLANLGTKTGIGADGIAIVFHNDPAGINAIGGMNAGLGAGYGPYTAGGTFQEGIKKGIALELDTYQNDQATFGDIVNDHGQIWLTANQRTGQLTTPVDLGELEDGTWKTVIVNWNATTQTISYTVNGTLAGTYTGDLVTNVFGANMVHVGFTASTGGFSNTQSIKFDSFCTDLPIDLDTDGDGVPNRLDNDSDGDGCPDAIEGGSNITASQVSSITGRITGNVDGNGVPLLIGSTGQSIGNAQASTVSDCYINATNDINQASVGSTVSGNLTTNDAYANTATISSARYYNASGVLTAISFGVATPIYTSAGVLAGTMTLNADGTYTFVLANGFVGTVPLNYTLTNTVGVSDTADLSIEVKSGTSTYQNDSPLSQNDTAGTKMNVSVSSTVLSNDSDPDGNTLTITSASVTLGTTTTVSGTDANGNAVSNAGSIILNANGTYTFTPSAGFMGTVNPINYTVSDGNGGSDSATLNIVVNRDLGNTIYPNDDANAAPKGTTMTGNILSNDTDPENNTLAITSATANSTALTIGTATNISGVGTLTLNSNGTYVFIPLSTYVGTTSVVYTVCDSAIPSSCKQATLYLTSLKIEACTIPGLTTGTPSGYATTGISVLNNHLSSNWPTTIPHSFLPIESLNKGLVITRMDSPETQIAVPSEGMVVWDNDDNCMKLYTTAAGWHCISQGCKE